MSLTASLKDKLKPCRKLYPCDECKKNFTRPSALQTHSYVHTGEKPHACDKMNCGRRFTVISNLRRHMRVHQNSPTGRSLTAKQRLESVEQLIHKTDYNLLLPELSVGSISPTLSSGSFSSNGTDCFSSPVSPKSVCIDTNLRYIRPKESRHKYMFIEHLLN